MLDRYAVVDWETRSKANLRELGTRAYFADPTTEPICLSVLIDGEWLLYTREPVPGYTTHTLPEIASKVAGRTLVAHNVTFDRMAWDRWIGTQHQWFDTASLARQAGMPAGLDKVSEALLGEGKSADGDSLVRTYCSPKRGKFPELGLAWPRMIAYNRRDCTLTERVLHRLLGMVTPEWEVLAWDAEVNARGVPMDRAYLQRLDAVWAEWAEDRTAIAQSIVGADLNLRSVTQVQAWLKAQGVEVPSLRKEVLDAILDDPESEAHDPKIAEMLRARMSALRASRHKVTWAIAALDADGRLRDTLLYYGAQATGRWSGRGFQPQNMARSVDGLDHTLCDRLTLDVVKAEAARLGVTPDAVLVSLIRPAVCGDLQVADYAGIEARVVAWLCDDEPALDVFRSGQDPYKTLATRLFGVPLDGVSKVQRQIAKVVELGCGYQMGAERFGEYARLSKCALGKLTPEECVGAYRRQHEAIVQGWRKADAAARRAITHGSAEAVRCRWSRDGGDVLLTLPSGRVSRYRNCRIEPRPTAWDKDTLAPAVVYEGPYGERSMYGGKWIENIVQATARDLLAAVRPARCCLHVHDELVTEGGSLRDLCEAMASKPEWAYGLPIKVEGFATRRYCKGATQYTANG